MGAQVVEGRAILLRQRRRAPFGALRLDGRRAFDDQRERLGHGALVEQGGRHARALIGAHLFEQGDQLGKVGAAVNQREGAPHVGDVPEAGLQVVAVVIGRDGDGGRAGRRTRLVERHVLSAFLGEVGGYGPGAQRAAAALHDEVGGFVVSDGQVLGVAVAHDAGVLERHVEGVDGEEVVVEVGPVFAVPAAVREPVDAARRTVSRHRAGGHHVPEAERLVVHVVFDAAHSLPPPSAPGLPIACVPHCPKRSFRYRESSRAPVVAAAVRLIRSLYQKVTEG